MTHRLGPRMLRGQPLAWLCAAIAACGGDDGAVAPAGSAGTLAITAPPALASGLTGSIAFSANATDVGVAGVEFQIDGVTLVTDVSAPFGTTIDSSRFASGQHVLRVRARDAAGNPSAWVSATVSFGGSRTQPGGFTRDEGFVSGLGDATAFAQAPDGRLFVARQSGELRVVKNGALLATPFMTLAVDSSGE